MYASFEDFILTNRLKISKVEEIYTPDFKLQNITKFQAKSNSSKFIKRIYIADSTLLLGIKFSLLILGLEVGTKTILRLMLFSTLVKGVVAVRVDIDCNELFY